MCQKADSDLRQYKLQCRHWGVLKWVPCTDLGPYSDPAEAIGCARTQWKSSVQIYGQMATRWRVVNAKGKPIATFGN